MTTDVEPTLDKPMPKRSKKPDRDIDLPNKARIAGNTAMLLEELGASFDMTEEDNAKAAAMFKEMTGRKATKDEEDDLNDPGVALSLSKYINDYDKQVVQDKIQIRNIVTNRLLQMSTDEDARVAIKALELLGKSSDLFTEHSEITITHKTSDELKEAIRERIKLLMETRTIDITPKAEKLANSVDVEVKDAE